MSNESSEREELNAMRRGLIELEAQESSERIWAEASLLQCAKHGPYVPPTCQVCEYYAALKAEADAQREPELSNAEIARDIVQTWDTNNAMCLLGDHEADLITNIEYALDDKDTRSRPTVAETVTHEFVPHCMDNDFCAAQLPHVGGTHTCGLPRSAVVHPPKQHKFVPPPFDCGVDREPLCRAIVKSSAEYVMNGGAEYRTCYEIEANKVHKE